MNQTEFIGYAVLAIITLGSFVAVVQKFNEPINELKIVIQDLKGCIRSLKEDNSVQNKRLDKHGEEIDELKSRVKVIENDIKHYHE